jgi:hypothetical protein
MGAHTGLFPPSSKVTFFRFESAAALSTARPVTVEPVKATLLMSMWYAIADPAVLPYPEIKLITPGGKPACLINSAQYKADKGVASADLITTVQPVATAGQIFQMNMRSGKFQGMI